jgi:ribonuclease PH
MKAIQRLPMLDQVAAISCGVIGGVEVLDLDYAEDSGAEVDANFVLTAKGGIVEVQATAETRVFDQARLMAMLELARQGTAQLFELQRGALARHD